MAGDITEPQANDYGVDKTYKHGPRWFPFSRTGVTPRDAAAIAHGLPTGKPKHDSLKNRLGQFNQRVGKFSYKNPYAKAALGNPVTAGLIGALPLAALGYGGAKAYNYLSEGTGTEEDPASNRQLDPKVVATVLGGLGLLGGATLGYQRYSHNKKASMWGAQSDPYAEIMQALQNSNIPSGLKYQAMGKVSQLPRGEAESIARMIGTTIGAATGMMIVRMLGGGLAGMGMGAIAGGFAGNYGGGRAANAFGDAMSLSRFQF